MIRGRIDSFETRGVARRVGKPFGVEEETKQKCKQTQREPGIPLARGRAIRRGPPKPHNTACGNE